MSAPQLDEFKARSIGRGGHWRVVEPYIVKGPVIAVGDNRTRTRLALENPQSWGWSIHPSAIIAEDADIGEGSMICAGAIIQTGAKIGRHCIINTGSTVDHDCVIGDFCHIAPNSTLCGAVTLGDGVFVGAGTTIIQCLSVGEWSTIGAGSVVVREIGPRVIAYGIPARAMRLDVSRGT